MMHLLALMVENLDARCSRRAEPVAVGRENKGVDDVTGLERVEVLALVEIPEHGDTILTTGRRKGAIRGNRNGVDVTSVAVVVSLELKLGKLPDLSK